MSVCVELPETDAEVLAVRKGDRLTPGVSDVAADPEPAGETLPAAVRDPIELGEA